MQVVVSAPDQLPTPSSKELASTVVSNRRLQEEGLGLGVADRGDGVGLTVGDVEALTVAVAEPVTDGDTVGVRVGDSEMEPLLELESEADTVGVTVAERD